MGIDTVRLYYLFNFLTSLHFFAAVLVPFFTEWGHISLVQVTILQSWFMLWIFLLEVPTGAVADYVGRKYSLALGTFVIAAAVLVYGTIPKFEVFLFAEFLFAMGVALISGADEALLYDSLKEQGRESESTKIFGKAQTFDLLGMLAAAVGGSFLASKFGLNAPLLFSAIPMILGGVLALVIREPKIHEVSESKRYLTIAKRGLSYLYHHKDLQCLALNAMIVSSAAYFVIWLYQPTLRSINIPIIYFGFAHALLISIEILVTSNTSRFEKIFGSTEGFLNFSAIVTAASFILLAAKPNIITIALFLIFAGGFGLTRLKIMSGYMNKLIPSSERATVISSISMFRRVGLVFLNPLIGYTADSSLRLALLVVGILPLLSLPFWKRKK